MKRGLIPEKAEKYIFTIDKLEGVSPELLEEFFESGFTEIEKKLLETLSVFKGPVSVRKIRSILIQKTALRIFEDMIKHPKKDFKNIEILEQLVKKLNISYLNKDYPTLIGEDVQSSYQSIIDFCNHVSHNFKDYKNIESEFLLSEKLAKDFSKAGVQVYGMKRIQDAIENLERSDFIMERKQSPTNKTRLFFLNPKTIIFLRNLFKEKKK